MFFGEYLVTNGILSQDQVEQILTAQMNNKQKKFGEIAADLGFIDSKTIENAFQKFKSEK